MDISKTVSNEMIICDGAPYRNLIGTRFDDVLPNLPPFVQQRLEQDILENGVQLPLILWEIESDPARYELVTGHFEYSVAVKHNLPFSVMIKKFDSEYSVIRFIINGTLNRLHLNLFQKGELVLKHKDILTSKGKENMILAGKGIRISEQEKVDTIPQLSAMIGCSHETLRKVQI